ncbi:glycosyltransferase WbuB [Bdellovibrio bacteriovorus]|uniref:Glycosyltransferase WbuB n=1 Tax=Bdellovibrio bacteriovorus TaxID=959 RepID=A0A150WL60_BDEBC|nr:glycosyltransferase family 4 protein [Bdellovibrio bacteriovorus]KYG64720.1 glycosyltransferase WbuB [Bdellovibrio bacteriovorus]
MRILILTQWFDPEPTFKGLLFAKGLKSQGHEVEVVTGFPNYPGGDIYENYRLKLYQKQIMDDICVHRVWLYPSHDGSALKRISNYVSFCISSFIFGTIRAKKFDVIYVYHPPATVGFSAALVGLIRRVPFVYDIQDLWPDSLRSTGMLKNERILKVINMLCNWIYKRADKIVVLSPGFKKALITRGVAQNKIEVIYNWCDEKSLSSHSTGEEFSFLTNKFNILFAGNMGKAQGLESVLEAAEKVSLKSSYIQFVFVGGGIDADRLKKLAQDRQLTNVIFVPRMPVTEVGRLMSNCDVLLVHLKKDPLFEITVPSKTQAYMSIGKPVLMAVPGDAAELIRLSGGGICVPSENPEALSAAVLDLSAKSKGELKSMGDSAKSYYEENLSFKNGITRFLKMFEDVIS